LHLAAASTEWPGCTSASPRRVIGETMVGSSGSWEQCCKGKPFVTDGRVEVKPVYACRIHASETTSRYDPQLPATRTRRCTKAAGSAPRPLRGPRLGFGSRGSVRAKPTPVPCLSQLAARRAKAQPPAPRPGRGGRSAQISQHAAGKRGLLGRVTKDIAEER